MDLHFISSGKEQACEQASLVEEWICVAVHQAGSEVALQDAVTGRRGGEGVKKYCQCETVHMGMPVT